MPKDRLDDGKSYLNELRAHTVMRTLCVCVCVNFFSIRDMFDFAVAAGFVDVVAVDGGGGFVTDVVSMCQMSKLQYHFEFLRFDTFRYQIMRRFRCQSNSSVFRI